MPFKDPEKQRASQRKYRASNLEKVRESSRASARKQRLLDPEATRVSERAKYAENSEKLKAASSAWRRRNPDKVRAMTLAYYSVPENAQRYRKEHPTERSASTRKYTLKRKYGLTPTEFEEMFEKQGRVCVLCLTSDFSHKNGRCMDHDHTTKSLREILCNACNTALGLFKDNPEVLRRAAAYVERHRANPSDRKYSDKKVKR